MQGNIQYPMEAVSMAQVIGAVFVVIILVQMILGCVGYCCWKTGLMTATKKATMLTFGILYKAAMYGGLLMFMVWLSLATFNQYTIAHDGKCCPCTS
jgi:hypothetical protein